MFCLRGQRFSHPVRQTSIFIISSLQASHLHFNLNFITLRSVWSSSPSSCVWYPFQKAVSPPFFRHVLYIAIPNDPFSFNGVYNVQIQMHFSANLFILDVLLPRYTARSSPEIRFSFLSFHSIEFCWFLCPG